MVVKSLEDILTIAQERPTQKIAVAAAEDEHVLGALKRASDLNIVECLLIGDKEKILSFTENLGFKKGFGIIDEKDPVNACKKAVKEIREGRANILMKGMVSTAPLLKAVLDKEEGLRKRNTLSHLAVFQTSYYPGILGVSDAAMNISPGIEEKKAIIENSVDVFHSLGYDNPRVAIIGPVEIVNPKIPSTIEASVLTQMNRRNQISGCTVDGPLAIDNAVSPEAARQKKIDSEVAGKADILIAPDLNSGNILYKTMIFLSDARSAAVILGAKAPIVLTSRADSEESKLYSIALAAAI